MDKKIIIIGGGPGGYVAAIRAAQLGAKVTLIEKEQLGGTCLNRGCVPTKALYRNSEILSTLGHIDDFGININNCFIDINKAYDRKDNIVSGLRQGIEQLLKGNKIEIVKGKATLKNKNSVLVEKEDGNTEEITGDNIIIATGSKPSIPPIPGASLEGVLTSDEILELRKIPSTLTVIGGGVIGMEFACIFNAMGSKVKVIEFLPNILPPVDTDLTKRLVPSLKKRGIEINTSTKVTKIEKEGDKFIVHAEGKKGEIKVDSEYVLIAVGRMPILDGLKLEDIGIDYDRKGITVDNNYETNVKGIYAIGDVNGKIMLAHAASHQGEEVVERIMEYKKDEKENANEVVPNCIFIFPEISCVGLTEAQVKDMGIPYKTSKFAFRGNCKAQTLGEEEGMVKVIAEKKENGEEHILGVHIMGPHASDLIHEGALAITNGMGLQQIKKTIHAHPTLSEAFVEAVLGLNGEAIHSM